MLVGLAAKNGILIVEFANQLRDAGRDIGTAIREAARRRLRPILMTSIATVAGAVPLMLASGAGAAARTAIGVVIVFGVSIATLITLFLIPLLYSRLARYTGSPLAVTRKLEGQLPGRGRSRSPPNDGAGMTEIASKSQLRMSFLRYALVTVPAVVLLGTLSGALSGSGADNQWYRALDKSPLNPPGWVFGIVWPILYVLLGLSLAMVLHAKGAREPQPGAGPVRAPAAAQFRLVAGLLRLSSGRGGAVDPGGDAGRRLRADHRCLADPGGRRPAPLSLSRLADVRGPAQLRDRGAQSGRRDA